MLQSSNKYSATATILSEFIPTMDTLLTLREKYSEDEFGKMYNALPGAIKTGFTSLGCVEYEIATNEPVLTNRMAVVSSEPSLTIPKDCVIRTVVPGMELQGNIIRFAQVVVSSGSNGGHVADTPPMTMASNDNRSEATATRTTTPIPPDS
jgi:molecular chaperone GrpE (heat shock protein)